MDASVFSMTMQKGPVYPAIKSAHWLTCLTQTPRAAVQNTVYGAAQTAEQAAAPALLQACAGCSTNCCLSSCRKEPDLWAGHRGLAMPHTATSFRQPLLHRQNQAATAGGGGWASALLRGLEQQARPGRACRPVLARLYYLLRATPDAACDEQRWEPKQSTKCLPEEDHALRGGREKGQYPRQKVTGVG